MNRFLFIVILFIVSIGIVQAQGRWGIGVGSGIQNVMVPFRDQENRTLPAPVTLTVGRVFMIRNPDIAIWFYLRGETNRKTGTTGFGYRVYTRHRFGQKGTTKAFADLFLGITPYAYSFPYVGIQRASPTFFSVGLSQFVFRNQAIEASLGLYRTIQETGRGFGFQPSIGYNFFIGGLPKKLRSPKPKRYKNPTRCPESFN